MNDPNNPSLQAQMNALRDQVNSQQNTQSQPQGPLTVRHGLYPAKIGFSFTHELRSPLRAGNRLLPVGATVHLTVLDLTVEREAAAVAQWVCHHADCRGKHWATKGEIVSAHKPHRDLVRLEQTHLFLAVAEVPAVEARPAKVATNGDLIAPAVEARAARVVLLSDED